MSQRGYESIDNVIDDWVVKHQFTLFGGVTGQSDEVFRAVYLSSGGGECFQIWIDPPDSGFVSLHAANIETRNDEEFRHDWRVPLNELAQALEHAVGRVREWMARQ